MLYTIIPEEIIMKDSDKIEQCQEVMYCGKRLLVQPIDFKSFKVVQLISSDPNDFLDTNVQPGAVITMTM